MRRKTPNFANNVELNLLIPEVEDIEWDTLNWHVQWFTPIANKPTSLRSRGTFKYDIQSWGDILPHYLSAQGFGAFQNREIATGGDAIREQLAGPDLRILMANSYMEWKILEEQKSTGNEWEDEKIQRRKDFSVRRMELAKHFIQTNIEPEWMVLCLLPVLPPEPRPIVQLSEGELITSDLNELYRKVIHRNNTLTNLSARSGSAPGGLVICQKKLVQEAVDALLDNGIRGQPMKDSRDRPYKSFSDVIEGKEGRSRENLLGKRVDYSGRSVIVVGPSLPLHQCGLPREIAIELFQAFVIRGPIGRHLAPNLRAAKSIIRDKEPVIWKVLQEVLQGHPVSLNRAPTSHRLGIQAFQPILVEGRVIRLHPSVCGGFNADSDGDQMAVHVPLSLEAQAEARLLMFSHTKSIPFMAPVAGRSTYYYLSKPRSPYRERAKLLFHNKVMNRIATKQLISRLIDHFGMTYTSHISDQLKASGFQQATDAAISLGIDDLLTAPSRGWLVQDAEQQGSISEKHHHYGNVYAMEKLRQSIETWYATSEYLRQEMNPNFGMTDPSNPVHMMSFSGARGNTSQVHQLVGMRGLVSDPQGQIIDLPIQRNFCEGLSLTEYIISYYGTCKGVVDIAVRTSDTGYLTRRLVEIVQHIIVCRADCGTI
eukprot:Gb_39909 [translate_table: standard]